MPRAHLRRESSFKNRRRGSAAPAKSARPFVAERLEQRQLLAGFYDTLAMQLGLLLGKLDTQLASISPETNKLPIINQSVSQLAPIKNAFASLQSLVSQFSALDPASITASAIQQQLASRLISAHLLGDSSNDGIPDAADVIVSNVSTSSVKIAFNLDTALYNTQQYQDTSASASSQFGLGIDAIPFRADSSQNGSIRADLQYTNFTFGFQNGAFFFGDPDQGANAHSDLQFKISGNVPAQLDAVLGFLHVVATDINPGDDISLTLHADVNGSTAAGISIATPTLAGAVHIHEQVVVGVSTPSAPSLNDGLPKVQADLLLDWTFSTVATGSDHSAFGTPTFQIQNVKIDLGSALTSLVKPLVDGVQKLIGPFGGVLDVFNGRIPGISDLTELAGLGRASLLTIGGDAAGIPDNVIQVVSKTLDVIHYIDSLGASENGVMIPFGDCNVQETGASLLNAGASLINSNIDITSAAAVLQPLSTLTMPAASAFNLGTTISAIESLAPNGHAIVDNVINKFPANSNTTSASVELALPLLGDPRQALFKLLLGQNADLVTFEAKFHTSFSDHFLPVDGVSIGLGGVTASLYGQIDTDADVKIGYDTFGLREAVQILDTQGRDAFSTAMVSLIDGLYVGTNTHASLSGTLGAEVGLSFAVFAAGVDGGVTATIGASLNGATRDTTRPDPQHPNPQDPLHFFPTDVDGETDRLRPIKEMSGNFMQVGGSVKVHIGAYVAIGIEVPVFGFIGFKKEWDFASATLASFNLGGSSDDGSPSQVLNPYSNPLYQPAQFAAGQLIPNVGSNASARHYDSGQTNESVFVSYLPPIANTPGRYIVRVDGVTQNYDASTVNSIVINAGDGDDHIVIDKSVTVPVYITGGDGHDVIEDRGSGDAQIYGDDGSQSGDKDTISGGSGNNLLIGGPGDDVITGGSGGPSKNDQLYGDGFTTIANASDGSDFIHAGTSPATIYGGSGFDTLIGSASADQIHGGYGNDQITGNGGNDNLSGDADDDTYLWSLGDGSDFISDATGGIPVTAAGSDELTITGGSAAEQYGFRLGAPRDNLFQTLLDVPGNATLTLDVKGDFGGIEKVNIDPGAGADTINIPNLQGTAIRQLAANISGVGANSANNDHAVDIINVYGQALDDTMTISGKDVTYSGHYVHSVGDGQDFQRLVPDGQVDGMMYVDRSQYGVYVGNVLDQLNVYSDAGNDTLNFYRSTGPTNIYGGDGNDWLVLGGSSVAGNPAVANMDQFIGGITADAGTGTGDLLSFLDPQSAGSGRTYTFAANTFTRTSFPGLTFTGFDAAGLTASPGNDTINFNAAVTDSFLVLGQAGNDTVNLNNVPPTYPMGLYGEAGNDVFNFATSNNQTYPSVAVDGGADTDTIRVDDSSRTANITYTISAAGLARPGLTVPSGTSVEVIGVQAGSGNDIFNVDASSSSVTRYDLLGGIGNDSFNLGSTTASGLDDVLSDISSDGQAGVDALFLNTQAVTEYQSLWTIDATSLSRSYRRFKGNPLLGHGYPVANLESVTVDDRHGVDVTDGHALTSLYQIIGNAAGRSTRVYGSAEPSQFSVGSTANSQNTVFGAVTVQGGAAHDTFDVYAGDTTSPPVLLASAGEDDLSLRALSAPSAVVTLGGSMSLGSLSASVGARVTLPRNGSSALRVRNLSVATNGANMGRLDLNDNMLLWNYLPSSPESDLRDMLRAGYAGGAWTGAGVMSSTAAASSGNYTLGYADASALLPTLPGTFAGEAIAANTLIVRYTIAGDANLDRVVGFGDLVLLAQHYGQSGRSYADGDFKYSSAGKIDFDDLVILAQHYGASYAIVAAPIRGTTLENTPRAKLLDSL